MGPSRGGGFEIGDFMLSTKKGFLVNLLDADDCTSPVMLFMFGDIWLCIAS